MNDTVTARGTYEYIEMVPVHQPPTAKTGKWIVVNKRHNHPLGEIKWDCGWRQYTYWPTEDAMFSAGCLRDIADFIEKRMAERKAKP